MKPKWKSHSVRKQRKNRPNILNPKRTKSFRKDRKMRRPADVVGNIFWKSFGRNQQKSVPENGDVSDVNLSRFDFVDNPLKTLSYFEEIARKQKRFSGLRLNFLDEICRDISPYLLLSMTVKDLRDDFVLGGTITDGVSSVLQKTKLADKIGIKRFINQGRRDNVWPMTVSLCKRKKGQRSVESVSGKEAMNFVNHLNSWLGESDIELTREGEFKLFKGAAEIIDNALTHSQVAGLFDEAWTAGCMTKHTLKSTGEEVYLCHFSVINFGCTVDQSISDCFDDKIGNEVETMVNFHSKAGNFRVFPHRWRPSALRTLYAMQDGVTSRDPKASRGGKGILNFVEIINEIGGCAENINAALQNPLLSRVAILSGNAYIRVPAVKPQLEGNRRVMALNDVNDLRSVPDRRLVLKLKKSFPGTLLTTRFVIKPEYLARKLDGE